MNQSFKRPYAVEMDRLMNSHKMDLEKKYLKIICQSLYYLGLGDFWFESTKSSKYCNYFYSMWTVFANVLNVLFVINTLLAKFRLDLTLKEKNDYIQFAVAFVCIFAKYVFLHFQRSRVPEVLKLLVADSRLTEFGLGKYCLAKIKRYCISLFCGVYLTFIANTLDGIKTHFSKGIPVRTTIYFYPHPEDTGILTNTIRFLIEVHAWYMVSIMIWIDCLSFCCLIILQFKFKLIRAYFDGLKQNIWKKSINKDQKMLEEDYQKGFVIGIKLQRNAIWCSKNIQLALGNIYSAQVLMSVSLFVTCLVELASTRERGITFLLSNLTSVICIALLTASYMMAAGDISFEASTVSTSIFHSGWEFSKARPELRKLVVIALQRSQVPVQMTAFGMLTLSYASFILILRTSYSWYAVMYTY